MKYEKLLNKYLSNHSVLITKLHNLHWNVTGIQFMAIHEFTEKLYDEFFEQFDAVAELLKMKGKMPLSTTKAYLENSSIEELEPKSFTPCEVLSIVEADLIKMKEEASEIRIQADEVDDFATANMMEDHIESYVKTLWFISAMTTK